MTIEVNWFYLDRAALPWFYMQSEEPRPERYVFAPDDTEHIAQLARLDLVPWLRAWPVVGLQRLRSAMEYSFEYSLEIFDHPTWDGQSQMAIDDPLTAIWLPVWDELFGGELVSRPESDYHVLRGSAMDEAMVDDLGNYRFTNHLPVWLTELAEEEE